MGGAKKSFYLWPCVRLYQQSLDKFWEKYSTLILMARRIVVCVIETNYTKVNDPGQKNASWCLKVSNFDDFFQKNAYNGCFSCCSK